MEVLKVETYRLALLPEISTRKYATDTQYVNGTRNTLEVDDRIWVVTKRGISKAGEHRFSSAPLK